MLVELVVGVIDRPKQIVVRPLRYIVASRS